jgi:hypothetical protein
MHWSEVDVNYQAYHITGNTNIYLYEERWGKDRPWQLVCKVEPGFSYINFEAVSENGIKFRWEVHLETVEYKTNKSVVNYFGIQEMMRLCPQSLLPEVIQAAEKYIDSRIEDRAKIAKVYYSISNNIYLLRDALLGNGFDDEGA